MGLAGTVRVGHIARTIKPEAAVFQAVEHPMLRRAGRAVRNIVLVNMRMQPRPPIRVNMFTPDAIQNLARRERFAVRLLPCEERQRKPALIGHFYLMGFHMTNLPIYTTGVK